MAALLIFLALAAAGPGDPSVPIFVGGEGAMCGVGIEGRVYALPADEARMTAHLNALKRRHRRARLVLTNAHTSYRCVGAVLHRAGRIGLRLPSPWPRESSNCDAHLMRLGSGDLARRVS